MIVSTFSPSRALRNPHLQTILPRLLRRRALLAPVWQRLTLPDGDFIDLAWSEAPQPARHKPRVVLFHGLEGSVHSPYAHGLLHACREAGWLAVVMHFRGCSGEPNLTPVSYTHLDVYKRQVLHCKGVLARALPMMQQTEQVARRHQTYHYALWALLQQSEILIAQGFLQAAYETQDKAFELVDEQHLQQLPMHEFLLRIRAQVLWSWMRLDEAERAARDGLAVLANFEPQQQLQCLALLAKCSLARGDLDNAGQHLRRCETLLQAGNYHSDWLVNADKARVIYWQITGDRQAASRWLLQAVRPAASDNHFLQGQWRNIARVQIMLGQYDEAQAVLCLLYTSRCV